MSEPYCEAQVGGMECGRPTEKWGQQCKYHDPPKSEPTNSIDSELEEILSDLIYDTPNHYGYPPDFEPDFKKALQAIKALYRKEVEEAIEQVKTDIVNGHAFKCGGNVFVADKVTMQELLPPTKGGNDE